ncbi:hypothetical protein QBC39DRAFT_3914 [Podospora conica]|nr:hypothetical protein QBC39DRAFT_3914 [Schizothecium conicum]
MEDNGHHPSFNQYSTEIEPSSPEGTPGERTNSVDAFQFFSEIRDDDLYPSLESYYALSSEYPTTIDLSPLTESFGSNHELIASYEPMPAPSNALTLDMTVGRAPSSIGDSSNDEPQNTPGTDEESMVASPVDRCAENPFLHSPNRRDDPESDNSCALSLRVNTGSASNSDDEMEKLGLEAGSLASALGIQQTEAAAAGLMRLRLGSSTTFAESTPRSSPLDDSPVPPGRRGNRNTPRMGIPRSARRAVPGLHPAESYPYPQRGARLRESRK